MGETSQDKLKSVEDTAHRAGALAAVCRLVAHLLREKLDEGTAEQLCKIKACSIQSDFVLEEKACLNGLLSMQGFLANGKRRLQLQQASDDYHDLFVGPHKLLAPPWSSVYLDEGGILFGPTALKVKRIYASRGFAIPEGSAEPSDHAAYEWQFLANLQNGAMLASNQGNGNDAQQALAAARDFFEDYAKPWMDTFCVKVLQGARTEFYRGLAEFTEGLLSLEDELFSDRNQRCFEKSKRRQ